MGSILGRSKRKKWNPFSAFLIQAILIALYIRWYLHKTLNINDMFCVCVWILLLIQNRKLYSLLEFIWLKSTIFYYGEWEKGSEENPFDTKLSKKLEHWISSLSSLKNTHTIHIIILNSTRIDSSFIYFDRIRMNS